MSKIFLADSGHLMRSAYVSLEIRLVDGILFNISSIFSRGGAGAQRDRYRFDSHSRELIIISFYFYSRELIIIFVFSFWHRGKRPALSSAIQHRWITECVTLGSLCLPCCVQDTT